MNGLIAERNHCALALALLAGAGACAVAFDPLPASAQAVVQRLPGPEVEQLNNALRRLSRNPNSLPALLDAGRASLELDDIDAAEGFYTRAQTISPEDRRALAGLAVVAVRKRDAPTALGLFERAERVGADLRPYAADRGLAHDLVGDNLRAQGYYADALARDGSDELIRRLALSYAIAGDLDASEATLLPLLQRSDRAAYRTRAFALAILGQTDEAVSIVETMLPGRMSRRLAPYMRSMPQLTRAQQAAAANLGVFPEAEQIGHDHPAILAAASAMPQPRTPVSQSVDSRLIPEGAPLGSARAAVQQAQVEATEHALARQNAEAAPPEPSPAGVSDPVENTGELPALASSSQLASETPLALEPKVPVEPVPTDTEVAVRMREEPVVVAALEPAPSPQDILPPPSNARAGQAEIVEAVVAPEPELEQAPVALSEIFADFAQRETEAPLAAAAGAVDIRTLDTPREEPQPPPAPPVPSRQWVQLATGQNTSAFRFDWRRIARQAEGLLDDRTAYYAPWGETNRLVTGPFESASAANQFVTALKEKGVDSFRFTSARGEELTEITGIPAVVAPVAPAHPSRHWVQVATGQNTSAFRFDWRRITRQADGLLDDTQPFRTVWGQSNRLVAGPFTSADDAQAMVTRLAGKGIDSFRFTSAEGQEMTPVN